MSHELDDFYNRLAGVVATHDTVPPDVVEAAKASFWWRSVEDELADLVYDSSLDSDLLVGVRGGSGRQLTFATDEVAIEVEVDAPPGSRMVGQLVPPQPAEIEIRHLDGSIFLAADELGRFSSASVPEGPMSLRCKRPTGSPLATDWVTL
jgi:hypothetical protein